MSKNFSATGVRYLIYVIAFIGFLGILFNWTLSTIIHSRKEVTVPNLIGKTLFESLELLSPLNLGMRKVAVEFDKSLPAGVIVRQTPYPGMVVREGRIVQVTVAVGSESVFVPQLTALTLRQAEIKIRTAGLTVGEVNRIFSLKYAPDYVVKQNPPAGKRIPKETPVVLEVSMGPPPQEITLMPDFVGKSVEEVIKWEEANSGQFARINYIYEENHKQIGLVVKQSPEFDTVLTSTHTIQIIVGK